MPKRFAPSFLPPDHAPRRGSTLQTLIDSIRDLPRPVRIEQLRALLDRSNLTLDDVRPYLHLNPTTYSRNGVFRCDAFEVMVFCWQAGQKSPIHDHSGSACGVRVINGTALETVFALTTPDSTQVIPVSQNQLRTGEVTASFDSDIHEVANEDPDGELLVTLHVYSPPLDVMNAFEARAATEMDVCTR